MLHNPLILNRKLLSLSVVSTMLGFSTASHAVESVAPVSAPMSAPMPETTLPEIVITATRSPTPVTNVVAQTLVIKDEVLQRYSGQSVLDVLRQQAGFFIRQNGSDGSVSNFSLRGFDNKQILVLVDGIRYSSVTSGAGALNLLPASQIDRIEVLYGASGSSLYGADAMGGVIQVFYQGAKSGL